MSKISTRISELATAEKQIRETKQRVLVTSTRCFVSAPDRQLADFDVTGLNVTVRLAAVAQHQLDVIHPASVTEPN
jgi:hypothetical protein